MVNKQSPDYAKALGERSPLANMAIKKRRLMERYVQTPCTCSVRQKSAAAYSRLKLIDVDFENPTLPGMQLRNAWFTIPCEKCWNDILYVVGVHASSQKTDLITEMSDAVKEHLVSFARVEEHDPLILRLLEEIKEFYTSQQIYGLIESDGLGVDKIELHFVDHANYVGDPRYISEKLMNLSFAVFQQKAIPQERIDVLFPVTDPIDAVAVLVEFNHNMGREMFSLIYRDRYGNILGRYPAKPR